jgi:hypothetical protein
MLTCRESTCFAWATHLVVPVSYLSMWLHQMQ